MHQLHVNQYQAYANVHQKKYSWSNNIVKIVEPSLHISTWAALVTKFLPDRESIRIAEDRLKIISSNYMQLSVSNEEFRKAADEAPTTEEPFSSSSRPAGQEYALMQKGVVVVDTSPIFKHRGYAYILDGAPTWEGPGGTIQANDASMARIQFAKKTAGQETVIGISAFRIPLNLRRTWKRKHMLQMMPGISAVWIPPEPSADVSTQAQAGDISDVSTLVRLEGGEDGGEAGGEDGGDAGGEDGGEAGGEDGGEAGGEDGGEAGGEDGGEAGGEDGGEAGGEDGGEAGGEDGDEADDEEEDEDGDEADDEEEDEADDEEEDEDNEEDVSGNKSVAANLAPGSPAASPATTAPDGGEDVGGNPASGPAAVSPAKTAADPTSPVDATPVRPGKQAAEPFVMPDDDEYATPSKTSKTAEENKAVEKEKQAAKRK
ncbi:hypothetical protein CYMTET_39339 [Cymbomonas tetramitiformis]|uniref:Uncharacterized protein n=1 Tax=Cymbomonas tetramitiformis TaxID=36881 RepID=A0AAE0F5P7_9CHLO|nr:hypothetical protein CYMTET_39339 [Cymbomonas tetramitiformis]